MKPFIHAKNSVTKYGGSASDYIDIHEFIDSTKSALPDHRHRAILHSSFGIFITERVFGSVRTNSEGNEYSIRDVAEDHVYEDLGFIPTMEQWLSGLDIQPWMGGSERGKKEPLIDSKTHLPDTKDNTLDLQKWLQDWYKNQPISPLKPNYDRYIVTD